MIRTAALMVLALCGTMAAVVLIASAVLDLPGAKLNPPQEEIDR